MSFRRTPCHLPLITHHLHSPATTHHSLLEGMVMSGQQAVVGAKAPIQRVFGDLRFHTDGEVHALAFADDRLLWSLEEGGVLRHWNTDTGQQLGFSVLSDMETLWQFR